MPGTSRARFALPLAMLVSASIACETRRIPEPTATSVPSPPASSAPPPPSSPPQATAPPATTAFKRPAVPRLVAIGDLHGDLDAARRALRLAGAIDARDAWIGGTLVVVQTGDEIDRGDDDRAIVDLFARLAADAKKAGGDVVALAGNHEIMNASLDFRYVTDGGYASFDDVVPKTGDVAARIASVPAKARGRAAAFAPGGPYAKTIAARPVVVQIGGTVFAHGGVLPSYARSIDAINDATRAWLSGDADVVAPPAAVTAEDGPVWSRAYSASDDACATLGQALGILGASRAVVGHTVQHGDVSAACDGRVYRIDVGMSRAFGGPIEALEITHDSQVKTLREGKP